MTNLFRLLLLLPVAALAQTSVPLQLYDHVQGTEVIRNRPLPSGTTVWVVPRPETRAMRLREGYGEVSRYASGVIRDRLGSDGRTNGRYAPTDASKLSYYVLARTPDGRLYQSYVKTGDAGMQPGFDAVQGGRVSMGPLPPVARQALGGLLDDAPVRPNTPAVRLDSVAAEDPALVISADSFGAGAGVVPDSVLEAERQAARRPVELAPVGPLPTPSGFAWGSFLLGLLLGGVLAGAGLYGVFRQRMARQRADLLALMPSQEQQRIEVEQARSELSEALAAERTRYEKLLQEVRRYQSALAERDALLQRLLGDDADTPG